MTQITPSTIPSYYFDPEATYLISGGLGGIGRSTVKWMVERRAKHFILLSRSTNRSATVSMFLEEMKRKGTVIAALPCDVSDEKSLASVLRDCSTMPPIKGCIQGSVVVRVSLSSPKLNVGNSGSKLIILYIRMAYSRPCPSKILMLQSSQKFKDPGICITFYPKT